MTDPGAPPLNPNLQKLEAVLRGIEERTPHTGRCFYDGCNCNWQARVRAEQARAVERMVQEGIITAMAHVAALELKYPDGVPQGWDTPIIDDAWAAALRAVAPNPGTET